MTKIVPGTIFVLVCLSIGSAVQCHAGKEMRLVDSANLKRHVFKLAQELSPRDYEHIANLDRAADYIKSQFAAAGDRISEQPFHIEEWNQRNQKVRRGPYRNIIASFGPSEGARLIVGAHYDAYGPYPAADDNASGVAVLLE